MFNFFPFLFCCAVLFTSKFICKLPNYVLYICKICLHCTYVLHGRQHSTNYILTPLLSILANATLRLGKVSMMAPSLQDAIHHANDCIRARKLDILGSSVFLLDYPFPEVLKKHCSGNISDIFAPEKNMRQKQFHLQCRFYIIQHE